MPGLGSSEDLTISHPAEWNFIAESHAICDADASPGGLRAILDPAFRRGSAADPNGKTLNPFLQLSRHRTTAVKDLRREYRVALC